MYSWEVEYMNIDNNFWQQPQEYSDTLTIHEL